MIITCLDIKIAQADDLFIIKNRLTQAIDSSAS